MHVYTYPQWSDDDITRSLSSLKTILHRRHFPLGGHVTTATRETTSNAGILLRCWVMFLYTQDDIYPFSARQRCLIFQGIMAGAPHSSVGPAIRYCLSSHALIGRRLLTSFRMFTSGDPGGEARTGLHLTRSQDNPGTLYGLEGIRPAYICSSEATYM
jgi:hypothetical protein